MRWIITCALLAAAMGIYAEGRRPVQTQPLPDWQPGVVLKWGTDEASVCCCPVEQGRDEPACYCDNQPDLYAKKCVLPNLERGYRGGGVWDRALTDEEVCRLCAWTVSPAPAARTSLSYTWTTEGGPSAAFARFLRATTTLPILVAARPVEW